jgi:serine/threonine protein kinase
LDTSHSFHFLLTSFFPSFLASALKFLRENNLVHRDIKPQVRK